MKKQSVLDLKSELLATIIEPTMTMNTRVARSAARAVASAILPMAMRAPSFSVGIAAGSLAHLGAVRRSIALGVAKRGSEHRLAVRVQRQSLLDSPIIEHIKGQARGEVDVRVVGKVEKRRRKGVARSKVAATALALPWHQSRQRPLLIGCSVGHFEVTAGTLGCFVRRSNRRYLLSNNHVFANENDAVKGDRILQPGSVDGGRPPSDAIGELFAWIKLHKGAGNRVDAAIASLYEHDDVDLTRLRDIKSGRDARLSGVGAAFLDAGTQVYKVGRTTGATKGRVTAFDIDNLVIEYDIGNVRFDGQIEIEAAEGRPFSAGGDSGSLIVDRDMAAVGLLFAGGDTGGAGGLGLTYANPIHAVLADLDVELVY